MGSWCCLMMDEEWMTTYRCLLKKKKERKRHKEEQCNEWQRTWNRNETTRKWMKQYSTERYLFRCFHLIFFNLNHILFPPRASPRSSFIDSVVVILHRYLQISEEKNSFIHLRQEIWLSYEDCIGIFCAFTVKRLVEMLKWKEVKGMSSSLD